ncbi:muconolactone Delta-isomerase family protein [Leucobacter rhizosphaerae]|uniref:muconolactone Delta-isomerase n=1 Tax=Leucobacter rhizosphaerae TaxID=2932245 RepID=A0ABY4FTG4_9MICO|nr:muconolactone Delta-isomerase family protein [Leucobacter rhizosphaerae]UOQ59536.1 muconolactone Delta-isomerase family protein [Leucobacter rhizosphaerae]
MEFLININITWPESLSEERIAEISAAERAMAAELGARGTLVRMWRVPGRRENWGLWRAATPTEMHDVISALPVWPYMEVQIIPLAVHPVDPAAASGEIPD